MIIHSQSAGNGNFPGQLYDHSNVIRKILNSSNLDSSYSSSSASDVVEATTSRVSSSTLATTSGSAYAGLASAAATVVAGTTTSTFSSASDTYLSENKADKVHDAYTTINVDLDRYTGSGKETEAVLSFKDLIGTSTGKIPPGAHIVSATLILETTEAGGGAAFYRLLKSVSDKATWNSTGDGIQTDGKEAASTPDAVIGPTTEGKTSIDVTKSLQAWADGAANLGWAIVSTSKDGWEFASAESATKPRLIVQYSTDDVNENANPIANDDSVTTAENSSVKINVLSNDSDADGDSLSITKTSAPAHGTVQIGAGGVLTYTPGKDFVGSDSFTYTISDGHGGKSTATVDIDVNGVNTAPIARNDLVSTTNTGSININVLTNDMDPDGDKLTVTSVSGAVAKATEAARTSATTAHGTVSINADGTIKYVPQTGFVGTDSFTYTVSDGKGGTATAVATIKITSAGSDFHPTAGDDAFTVAQNTSVALNVLSNDVDLDGDKLSVTDATDPTHGTVTINANGTITYKSDAGFSGTDTFQYTINDGNGETDTATVTVTVDDVNHAPVVSAPIADQTISTAKAFTFSVPSGAFTDSDGDSLSYKVALANGNPLPSWLTFDAATKTFAGTAPSATSLDIKVTVNDGNGGTASDTFTIKATAPSTGEFNGSVTSVVETKPVEGTWDVADDPAIWVNQADPTKSAIIGTNKDDVLGSLNVYDLKGNLIDTYDQNDSYNNVDIRYGFKLGNKEVTLIAATNRSDKTIDFFTIDATTRELSKIGSVETGMSTVYGFSLAHTEGGKFYAFSTSVDGQVRQFEINGSSGSITGKAVRTFEVGSQAEGITVDDKYGSVYVSQESTGIWKYDLDPASGSDRTLVDKVGSGHLKSDIEGLTVYYASNGEGYLIASSQGSSSYAVYDRESLEYLGKFSVGAGNGIDGVTETDGLDVTNVNLGGQFSNGMLVVHDHLNDTSAGTNFKLIAWDDVAALGNLKIDTSHDPVDGWYL